MGAIQRLAQVIIIVFALVSFKSSLTAGCEYVLSSESGWFTSPNHPEDYPDNANCSWLINTTHPIIVTFTLFNTERKWDVLKIYDGPTTSFPLLLQESSNKIPFSVASTTNQILVTFTSDGSGSYSGFNATYLSYGCQYLISSETGWFSSPNHPLKYPDNTNCRWLFEAKGKIKFSFSHFDLENKDWLTIYDGPTESSSILLKTSSNETVSSLIETKTHKALAVFTSDGSGSSSGFNATYSLFRCKHILLADLGWFTSPNHPGYYPDDAECSWLIKASQPIILSFTRFQIEKYRDWVTIYDGPSPTSSVLFRESSNDTIPTSIISTAQQMLITFTSDSGGSSSGFNATYSPYSCQNFLSSETGWFSSPNYPNSNLKNTNCSWLINSTQPITLSLTQFEIEYGDSIKFYNGPSTSSELLKDSNDATTSLIISSTNQMLVTFSTKKAKSVSKFNATYEPTRCIDISSPESGWFATSNHKQNISYNSCWLINVKKPIALTFTRLHLEENQDQLMVYDAQSTSIKHLLLKTSSNDSVPLLIVSSSKQVLVIFNSNGSNPSSGFNATYQPFMCQYISSFDSGWFTSPNHPLNYPDSLSSCWLINSTQPIMLSFNHFAMEENRDWLKVYDGSASATWKELLKATSNNMVSSVISHSNQMLITFTSDASNSFSGFNATYSPYSCNHLLSSESGWFTLQDAPLDYSSKSNCSWLFNTTHLIMLSFVDFFLNREYEFLLIYDGPTISSPLLKNSSDSTSRSSIISTTNQMLVTFTSSRLYSIAKFNATYTSYGCQHLLLSESGWFSSPNYPLNYPDGANCRWLIDAKVPITLSFPESCLENGKDWLMVYDGPTESFDLLLKASSSETIPSSVEIFSKKALVVFSSDGTNSYAGFNATYSPFRCNHVISSDSGWFTSPRHPSNYPNSIKCSWLINATHPIHLSFTRFEVEEYQDLVKIYNGPTESSDLLLEISSNEKLPSSIATTTNQALVVFTSDGSLTYSGFNATYYSVNNVP